MKIKDPEIRAMKKMAELLQPFDYDTRLRMMTWLRSIVMDPNALTVQNPVPKKEETKSIMGEDASCHAHID